MSPRIRGTPGAPSGDLGEAGDAQHEPVRVRAAFTPQDVIDMVRTGTGELGLLTTPGSLPEKEVASHPSVSRGSCC